MGYQIMMSLQESIGRLIFDVTQFLPQLIIAIVILVLGWIIGGLLGSFVGKAFRTFHIDDALDKAGVDELSNRAGYNFRPGYFANMLVKWFVIIAFAVVAFDVLGLEAVNTFMRDVVLAYLPQVFAAGFILFVGVFVANLAKNVLMAALRSSGTKYNIEFIGKAVYGLVIAFTLMAVLTQLQIADELINTLFMGIVFALSLGTGLAFGLGGRDAAGRYIDRMTQKNNHHS